MLGRTSHSVPVGRRSPSWTPNPFRIASSWTCRLMNSGGTTNGKSHFLLSDEVALQAVPPQHLQAILLHELRNTRTYSLVIPGGCPAILESLLELASTGLYGTSVHILVMRLLFLHIEHDHVHALAKALATSPASRAEAFYNDLTVDERDSWLRHGPLWEALVKALSAKQDTMCSRDVMALLAPYGCHTFALLFRSPEEPEERSCASLGVSESGIDSFLTEVQLGAADFLPQILDGELKPQSSDRALHATAIYLSHSPNARLTAFLRHLLTRIACACDLVTSQNLRPRPIASKSLCVSSSMVQAQARLQQLHPATPLLYCAIRLAERSRAVRTGLVERGRLLQVVARLYSDQDSKVPALGRHIMYRMCYTLLYRVSDCYDLSRTTLPEELRDDINAFSRRMAFPDDLQY